jgi:hypothetical protein
VISKEFTEFISVVGVFMDTELEVLAELFVEFLEILSILTDFFK